MWYIDAIHTLLIVVVGGGDVCGAGIKWLVIHMSGEKKNRK